MERDGDVVSPGFAPRFKEGPRLRRRLLIHHTSRSPGSDTLQCLAAEIASSPFMHAWPLFLFLLSVFSPSFSLWVNVRAITRASGKMDMHCFTSAPHTALRKILLLPILAHQPHLLQLFMSSNSVMPETLPLSSLMTVRLSSAKASESLITVSRNHFGHRIPVLII